MNILNSVVNILPFIAAVATVYIYIYIINAIVGFAGFLLYILL